ncbi:TPA: CHAP domain-containing protein [Streptococcus pneumoniae]|nr:CHAP domain-containing protein [Streptococcus pneumoniae]HEU8000577.1 CHAP domain-containing protein [Streptococcus pneumoniae]
MKDKREIIRARKAFRRSLKDEKKFLKQGKKEVRKQKKDSAGLDEKRWKKEIKEKLEEMREASKERVRQANEDYNHILQNSPPSLLNRKELRDRRLPHARKRLKIAKKQFREAKVEAKEERKESRKERKINQKFLYGQESKQKSNFFFQGKSLEELKAKKEVKAAKENLKSTKQAYKSKKVSRKAKTFLYVLGREGGELASENEDLEGYRTLQETIRKGKRYSRLSYNLGKASVKTGQATGRFTKKRLTNTKERYHHFKDGKGWKLAKDKPSSFKNRFRKLKKQGLTSVRNIYQKLKAAFSFFTFAAGNPVTWIVGGIVFLLLLIMSFFLGFSSASLIQQDEFELTKAYTHLTWEDAEHTRTNDKGITYYTKVDDVMGYMNFKFHDYELHKPVHLFSSETYKDYLSTLWHDLNDGEDLKSMQDLYESPKYKLSKDDQEEIKELKEEGVYASMQELDNPFEGKSNEDSLTMTYRYGYYDLDGKPTLQEYILLEAKVHQTIVAPMDGVVSLDGDDVILTNGKGENESRLTLYSIHNGRAIEGTRVLTGDIIGETPDDTGLKVSYQKYKNKKEKLVYVNPQFYFPKVIQLQTTILPAIGQFGGDEFERAKHIYEFLKSQGASPQAIAAILGNWSVESSINPKRAEGDYLSPPVGATDSSWDDESWLAIGGPAILLNYARTQNKKWYDLDLQLDFMLHGDSPYYQSWLKDFFKNTGSAANLAQLFLTYWEGNSGDKLLERQTRATEWYYQIEKGFSQTNGGQAKSDPQSLEGVRGDLYDHSVPGGGDGMAYAYGQCTWGVAARMNQLGLKLKGRNGEKISIINTMGNGQDWVATASSLGGETGSTPRAGAIVSFVGGTHGTPASYGHVAFVEKVYDDGSFLVSETNYGGNPNYTFRKISQADSAISFAYTTK